MATVGLKLSDYWAKGAKIINEDGLRHLLLRVLQKFTFPLLDFGSITFFVRELDEHLPDAKPRVQLELRRASPSEVNLLLRDGDPPGQVETLQERFRRGDLCFVGIDGSGRVAHSRWVTSWRARIPEVEMDVVLGPGEGYFYDGYTRPDLRGLRIDGAVRCFIFRTLRSAGFKRVYSYVRGDNRYGIRAARRWQHIHGRFCYLRLRGLRPLVMGRQKPGAPYLLKSGVGDKDESASARRATLLRAWFESWLSKPQCQRSGGFSALPEEYFESVAKYILETLRFDSGSDFVLDVGCDSAMVSRLLAPSCRRFVGVDFIPGMLADISPGAVRTASGRPAFSVAADGRLLPFRSRAFTKAYCSAVIHALPSRNDGLRIIEELVRVCRPGGRVLVASVPDAGKRVYHYRETWRQAGMAAKLRLLISLAIPRPAKDFLRAVLRLRRSEGLDFLDYDLEELRHELEAQGLQCEILQFPEDYWSRDFRQMRSNLLIRIPTC